MKTLVIVLLLVLIVFALAVTNPDFSEHKEVIYTNLRSEYASGGGVEGVLGLLGVGLAENFDLIPLQFDNYVVFSTVSLEGEIISIGFLGNVIII